MKVKLKNCPYCNKEAYFETFSYDGTVYITAHHTKNCGMKPNTWLKSSLPLKKQIKIWNQRKGD